MAQFKDLLVTGPVRMTSDIYFKNGKLSDGYLVLEPAAGEGGQILLNTAVNDQTNNGIIIDTANGDFRIFGSPSKNGASKTGNGSILKINPYGNGIPFIDASEYELKIKPSTTNSTSYNILIQENSGVNKTICSTSQNDFIQDLKLSQVYNYKGTVTWDQLKNITFAKVGDVYFISGADGTNKTGQSWACIQPPPTETGAGNNYATYWQSLGNYVDLSGYVTKDTNQTISGYKTFSNGLEVSRSSNKGIKVGAAYITAESATNGEVVLQGGHLRFGATTNDWDYNLWGGLGYAKASKTIALGLADGSFFAANQVQTGGTLTLPGIHYLVLSGKEAIAAYDSWLRINEDATFTSGIYCGNNIVRTDGQLQVGTDGSAFYAKNDGTGYFNNNVKINGEVQTLGANAFRMVQGDYSVLLRQDGSNTYFLVTAKNDQYGSWNTLRPLYFNNVTGDVTMGHNVFIGGDTLTLKQANFIYNTSDKCIDVTFN